MNLSVPTPNTSRAPAISVLNAVNSDWLTADDFARLAGIDVRAGQIALRKAVDGKPWRGCYLDIRTVQGIGGKSGERYEVHLSSLSEDLRWKWAKEQRKDCVADTPAVTLVMPERLLSDPTASKRTEQAMWIYSIIRPVLGLRRHKPERSAAVTEVLSREYTRPDGKRVRISKTQLYEWINRYEKSELEGLKPRSRKDAGHSRVLITRRWDGACPLDTTKKQAVAEALAHYVRSLWGSGVPGWQVVQRFATEKLVKLSRAAGWNIPDEKAPTLCAVTRRFVEQGRKDSLLAVYDQDAKQYCDLYIPRIRRNREGIKPMDVVVGDVHPLDIAVCREDGSIVYPRAICWHDVATNRLYGTLVLLEKGEGIKQAHVAASFAAMCAAWGLPLTLYLDNGSEYSWHEMMTAFSEISRLTQAMDRKFGVSPLKAESEIGELVSEQRQVVRARPYNAPAKPIEGLFSVIEQTVLSMIPGWTGGDRMRAKTHNVGKAPIPYTGTADDFLSDFDTALSFYHGAKQGGSMQGQSPEQAYRAHVDAGWTKTGVSPQVLLLAFAEEGKRKASRGYISWNGVEYYDDALLPYTGQSLTVRVARHSPDYCFVFDAKRTLICAAGVAPTFGFLDPAGAKEQARREKVMRRHVAEVRENSSRLDLVGEMREVVKGSPAMVQAPTGTTVAISDEAAQMLRGLQARQAVEQELLDDDRKVKAAQASPKRLSQWHSPDYTDPYLEAVQWSDEGE
ncbi:Mu transposase C-terminal domain-containing protein [Alcaligenes aquatilis]|uniref:Mu transposase C-terminal domain-containing protein n=1 Tax=Alcaligenes aquatilis TaxID=323284 RepID=UPI003752112A